MKPQTKGHIATVKLRYKEPNGVVSRLITANAIDEGREAFNASPDMQFAAAIAEFGMLLRNSPHKGTSTYADALQLARVARGEDLDGLREEFIRMTESARVLGGENRIALNDYSNFIDVAPR
jgi:Ca-activated chloride channel family protein